MGDPFTSPLAQRLPVTVPPALRAGGAIAARSPYPVWQSRCLRCNQSISSRFCGRRQRIRERHEPIRGIRDNVNPAGPRTAVKAVTELHGVRVVRHGGETQEQFAVGWTAEYDGLNPEIALWVGRVRARIKLITVIHAVAVAVDAKALAGTTGDESERDF